MCGIVGYVRGNNKLVANISTVIEDLLFIDTLRGRCGTGIVGIKQDNTADIAKRALAAPDFFTTSMWDQAKAAIPSHRVVIGHNRASTIGGMKDANSHPFHFKGEATEIVLVHNGTLNDYHRLGGPRFTHEVDSAYAAAEIAEKGPEEALKQIRGWYVFVWYDFKKKTFNIAKNDNRDIAWIFDEDGNMFFASEWRMLCYVLTRQGIDIDADKKNRIIYSEMPDHSWYEWPLDAAGWPNLRDNIVKHNIEPPKKPHYKNYNSSNDYGWAAGGHEGAGPRQLPFQSPLSPGARELSLLGLKPDENVRVFVDNWLPYNKDETSGRLEGSLVSKPDVLIACHGVGKAEYELLVKPVSDSCPVIINNVVIDMGNKKFVSARLDREMCKTLVLANGLTEESKQAKKLLEVKKKSKPALKEVEPAVSPFQEMGEAVVELVKGPGVRYIPITEFARLTKQGCAYCTDPIHPRDAIRLLWNTAISPPEVLCPVCQQMTAALELFNATDAVKMVG